MGGRGGTLVDSDSDFALDYQESERCIEVCGYSDKNKKMMFAIPQSLDKICTVLWPSGVVLADFVVAELSDICEKGCTVLELGCGSALPSMVAASLGAKAIATDMDMT